MDILYVNDKIGEYPSSWYADTAPLLPAHPPASGQISCDVCVIGAGYTGLSAALHLARMGMDVVLLEAQRVGFGASGRNGGQVSGGQRVDQDTLEKRFGKETARKLWDLGQGSVDLVHTLCQEHGIDAGYVPGIIHADHKKRLVPHTHRYVDKLQKEYGCTTISSLDTEDLCALTGSCDYHGGSLDMGSGHLHPLRYALGLAQAALQAGVRIFEQSRVCDIREGGKVEILTDQARVKASFTVIGCNGYLGNMQKDLARYIMPINNYIAVTAPLSADFSNKILPQNHAVADSRFVINYFRKTQDNRLLFGGGESYSYRFPKDITAKVRKPMLEIYPQLENVPIDYAWGGTLAVTMSRLPYFHRVAANIFSVGGYSGHGVALATLAGKMMAEAIQGKSADFDFFASLPSKPFPGGQALRHPLLVLAMLWYSTRDRL